MRRAFEILLIYILPWFSLVLLWVAIVAMLSSTCHAQGLESPTFIDVTNPPEGHSLDPAIPNDGNDDWEALDGIFKFVRQSGRHAVVYMPPTDGSTATDKDGYEISQTLTIGNMDSLRILGSGHPRTLNTGSANDGMTKITWTGGTTGPAVQIEDADGLVMQGVSIQSKRASADLDVLIKHINVPGGAGSLNLKFEDCGFHNAQTLFWNGDSDTAASTANILFDNVTWNGQHQDGTSSDTRAFYCQNNQGLIFTFTQNYWLLCGTCIHIKNGGRVNVYGGAATRCYKFAHKEEAGQNSAGFSVHDLYIDGGGTARLIWLSTGHPTTGRTYGPFLFSNIVMPGNHPSDGAQFAEITSWTGTTLVLADAVSMRPGDRVYFYAEDDHTTVLNETTVVTRDEFSNATSTYRYTVADTCCELTGLPSDLSTVDVAHGDGIFNVHGGATVTVRGCMFRNQAILGGRLARLQYASVTGRVPVIHVQECMGFSPSEVLSGSDLPDKYLDLNGTTTRYRFRDCATAENEAIFSATNIP